MFAKLRWLDLQGDIEDFLIVGLDLLVDDDLGLFGENDERGSIDEFGVLDRRDGLDVLVLLGEVDALGPLEEHDALDLLGEVDARGPLDDTDVLGLQGEIDVLDLLGDSDVLTCI